MHSKKAPEAVQKKRYSFVLLEWDKGFNPPKMKINLPSVDLHSAYRYIAEHFLDTWRLPANKPLKRAGLYYDKEFVQEWHRGVGWILPEGFTTSLIEVHPTSSPWIRKES